MRPLGSGRAIAPGVVVTGHLHRSNHLDVYAAHCERRGCPVVVKTPRPDRLRDGRIVRDLLREGRLLRRLAHPHVVRGYEVVAEPRPAIVLETVGGQTLAHLFAHHAPLPASDVAELGRQLASGVGYLHAEGYLHLDLKPSNAVAEAGRAKLLDLSIAQRPGRVRAGRGTWCNMAPEQDRGGVVGPAADVWGLGTVLFEAATGVTPFADVDQLEERADRVRDVRPGTDPALAAAIDGCLELDPADRPALRDLVAALG